MIKEGAIAMIRCIEWSGGHDRAGYCMWCGEFESKGHRGDCKLAALLDEAEGLDRDGKRVEQEEKQDELTYPIMICSACKKLDDLCECEGEPLRWRILQPEYYQSVLRTCGRGEGE